MLHVRLIGEEHGQPLSRLINALPDCAATRFCRIEMTPGHRLSDAEVLIELPCAVVGVAKCVESTDLIVKSAHKWMIKGSHSSASLSQRQ
jgi:hypothetical protein